MPRIASRRPGLAAFVLLVAACRVRAAEDCSDLGRIPACPPENSGCPAWACPPQDCSTCSPAFDDDGDCALDEELLNGRDDDNDGLVDEDISCLDGCDPLSFRCPTGLIAGSLIELPSPIDPPLVMEMLVRRQACTGNTYTTALNVVIEPDGVSDAGCARWQARIRVFDGAGVELLQGPAMIILSRRYETFERSLLTPPALGNVRVARYTVRADLVRSVAFNALPLELQIPCIDRKFRHVFFYGTLDVARDTFDPSNRRTALLLHHGPSSLSHPPVVGNDEFCDGDTVSTRAIPLNGQGVHDESFFMVAPAAGFSFTTTGTALLGDYKYGRIRTVAGNSSECSMETRICTSQWEMPAAPVAPTTCNGLALLRHARVCAGLDDSACTHLALSTDPHCRSILGENVAFFPVGTWSGTVFPAPMEVSAFEGGLSCVPPPPDYPWRPYWYGTLTRLPGAGRWLGPPDALDVIDNVRETAGGPQAWLIGACNWTLEDQPGEVFAPMQFGTMRFFAEQNPEIPRMEPCEATPAITLPGAADCTGLTALDVPCDGTPLVLSAECSRLVHCCQCGLPEIQWSRRDGGAWVVLAPWGDHPQLVEDPAPRHSVEYKLELRCNHSKRVCVGQAVLTLQQPTVVASPTADPPLTCPGQVVRLDAGACPSCTCAWTADVGPDPRDACILDVTPLVSTTYTVVVTDSLTGCVSDPASVDVTVSALAADAGADIVTCGCQPTTLTGSAAGCTGAVEYRWHQVAPIDAWICGDAATWLPETPGLTCPTSACGGIFELSVRCSDPPRCVAADRAGIRVEERPTFDAAFAIDPSPCDEGIDVTWEPAQFPSGSGTYSVYRSEVGCADAHAQQPLARGLRALAYADATTLDGHSYVYVVEAEDSVPTTACLPAGPVVGGAIAVACAAPVVEVGTAPPPVPPCWTLRARHVGDLVTMDWSLAHPLFPGEHFHLLKAAPDPRGPFPMLNPESDLSRTWTETDVSTRIQFFDLRIANRCELLTDDDEPPGFDLRRTCP